MRHNLKTLALTIGLATSWAGGASAAAIEMLFDFTGGFNASYNGGANAQTGQLTFSVLLDNTTSDLDASSDRGRFAVDSISLTAVGLGLSNELVVSPDPLFVDTFFGGLTIIGAGFDPDIGWNGCPAPSSFMADINDLSTLPLPFSTNMISTFFLDEIGFANGDTLSANIGNYGPDGRFSAHLVAPIPLPAFSTADRGWIGPYGVLWPQKAQVKLGQPRVE